MMPARRYRRRRGPRHFSIPGIGALVRMPGHVLDVLGGGGSMRARQGDYRRRARRLKLRRSR